MERVKGIEPSSQAWEAHILPLNHTRVLPRVCNRFPRLWQAKTLWRLWRGRSLVIVDWLKWFARFGFCDALLDIFRMSGVGKQCLEPMNATILLAGRGFEAGEGKQK